MAILYLGANRIQGANVSVIPTATVTITSATGENEALHGASGGVNRVKQTFATGHELIGDTITKFTMNLRKTGSPTGTATLGIYTSGDVLKADFGSIDSATLTTSFVTKTFNYVSGNSILTNGDNIQIRFSGGSGGNTIGAQQCGSCNLSNTHEEYYISSWTARTTSLTMTVTYGVIRDDKITVTNAQAGTLFEETDTRDMWWRDGSAWHSSSSMDVFSTATGWTGDTGTWAYNSSINGIRSSSTSVDKAVVKSIGKLSKTTAWVARFKMTRASGDQGDGFGFFLSSSEKTGSDAGVTRIQNDSYPYGIRVYVANSGILYVSAYGSNMSADGTWGSLENMATSTTKYIEIIHTSNTATSVKVYDSADYSDSPTTGTATNLSGQSHDYDQVVLGTKWVTGAHNADFEDWEVKIGVTSW